MAKDISVRKLIFSLQQDKEKIPKNGDIRYKTQAIFQWCIPEKF
ncbi:hypothetical protein [Mastigocoleus sp. MO_188.B34]|nr:hypothetical protein [Mastigocoleus sp. MO_188.B34]MDJ0694757.1 hypothetical protein [Mastigocoleus sp. MO_188.B34]